MKPLSPKALEKNYAELGLGKEKLELLHRYFRCFANLYGVISVRNAWKVFKHYEGAGLVRKTDFVSFTGIAKREAGLSYAIIELKEAYSGETTDEPQERLVVNGCLIGSGWGKYQLLYDTVERQGGKTYFLPATKAELLRHTEDPFYLSSEGKVMKRFLGELRTSGRFKDWEGRPCGEILDVNGQRVAGKRLSSFVFYTQDELSDMDAAKSEAAKERLRQKYRKSALDKVLEHLFLFLQTGGYGLDKTPAGYLGFLVEMLDRDFGVSLEEEQFRGLTERFMLLHNRSHLWLNCGWSPEALARTAGRRLPESISIGPGLKKMFECGEMDRAAFEKSLRELGIKLVE